MTDDTDIHVPFYPKKSTEAENSLKFLFIIHRHGHRTPLKIRFPSFESDVSKYVCPGHKPCKLGELTLRGEDSMKSLGKKLNKFYGNFLKEINPGKVYLRSTDYARTINSIKALSKGMFPNLSLANIIVPVNEDLYPWKPCVKYDKLKKEFFLSLRAQSAHQMSYFAEKYRKLSLDDKKVRLHGVFDSLYCRYMHGFALPHGITIEDINDFGNLSSKIWFKHYEHSYEMARLGTGFFFSGLKKWINNVDNNAEKVVIYSAHDSTIGYILSSLHCFDYKWPPFSSNVIFELHELSDKSNFVRIRYNGVPLGLPECKSYALRDDPSLCPLNKFNDIVSKLISHNWEEECSS